MGFITSLTIITVRTINIYWQLSENPKHYEHHSTHDISICLGYPGYVVAPRGVPASRKAEPCGLPVRSRIVTKAQACETAEGWRKWMMNVYIYIYMVFMLNIYIYMNCWTGNGPIPKLFHQTTWSERPWPQGRWNWNPCPMVNLLHFSI